MTTANPAVNIETRIEQYVALRDVIKERDDAHKAAMEPFRKTLDALNGVLLNHLQAIGGDSVATPAGTAYRTVKRTATLEDADAFMRHVIATEEFHLLDRKANVTAVQEFAAVNGVLPPGVKLTQTMVVGVRRG